MFLILGFMLGVPKQQTKSLNSAQSYYKWVLS